MRTVKFRLQARREISSAAQYYQEQGAPEFAERLLLEVDRAEQQLRKMAHAYPVVDQSSAGEPIRRIRLWRFPYMLVYVIDPRDAVQVFAFPHVKQDQYWKRRAE